jgi:hypothetical protein
MSIAVLSIAFNEEDIIGACVRNWKGKVDKHLVLVSSRSWNEEVLESDRTADIAKKEGAEVIVGYWDSEPEMRNWGLARLYDYDIVLIVDPDELYCEEDQLRIFEAVKNPWDEINRMVRKIPVFAAEKMITYWKTTDYIFDPPDKHKPFIAVDPKKVRFWNKRELMGITKEPPNIEQADLIDVTIHHLSWVKSDEKAKEKINTYSHKEDIPWWWYDKVWKNWTPQPCPEEICGLLRG